MKKITFLVFLFIFTLFCTVVSAGGYSGSGLELYNDGVANALKTITYPHSETHSGSNFIYSELVTIADTATRDILIVTPNSATKKAHLEGAINCIFECNIKWYEGTTVSNAGTGVTELNLNRSSTKTADTVLTHTPTVSGVGTLLQEYQIGNAGSAGGRNDFGGSLQQRSEWVLDDSATKYLLRITSAQDANDISIYLSWYEHTDSN